MRRVASLFAVGLVMALLHRATAGAVLEARASLALGFLLLAAPMGGELVRRARLPAVIGYLLVGFATGPAWLGLVRRDELDALRVIGDASVALIALAAGSTLTLARLRERGSLLLRLAAGAIAPPFVVVTAVVLSVTPWFPLTVHRSLGDGVAVALTLGVLAAASSPVITMTMIGELETVGAFARPLLGITVVQDVVAVALFALALAVAKAGTSAGALNAAVALAAVETLAGSLVAGAALGVGLGRYLRLVPRYTVVSVVAAAFVVAEAAPVVRLEPLLVALAAGFAVEFGWRAEAQRALRELRRTWTPLEVVFFGLAGAGLRLGALADLWPWVVLLVALRAVTLRAGMAWAARGANPPALARDGWLGLISQGGVALGLAQFARRAFPQWGVSLEALIVAMIGVHEVVGPACCRLALVRAGERAAGPRELAAAGDGGLVAAPGSAP